MAVSVSDLRFNDHSWSAIPILFLGGPRAYREIAQIDNDDTAIYQREKTEVIVEAVQLRKNVIIRPLHMQM